jgi:hypothetical protein
MLVCNVSLRPARAAIAASLAEAATAADATATGNVVFATLVDDPANVRDVVDAYLGEIMVEAASAADAIDAGLVYVTAIDEATTASATESGAVPVITAGKTAMLAAPRPVFVNAGTSREAALAGPIMGNL